MSAGNPDPVVPLLIQAAQTAAALRDQLLADGDQAIGASILASYLSDIAAWAIGAQAHREHWRASAEAGFDEWFRPDPEEETQAALRSYLRGD